MMFAIWFLEAYVMFRVKPEIISTGVPGLSRSVVEKSSGIISSGAVPGRPTISISYGDVCASFK